MGLVRWKKAVTSPHEQSDQHQLENSHDMVCGVVEFIHGPFLFVEGLQITQHRALLNAGLFVFFKGFIAAF